jgi:hypothetical protein
MADCESPVDCSCAGLSSLTFVTSPAFESPWGAFNVVAVVAGSLLVDWSSTSRFLFLLGVLPIANR